VVIPEQIELVKTLTRWAVVVTSDGERSRLRHRIHWQFGRASERAVGL